jgi:hypothetical protein
MSLPMGIEQSRKTFPYRLHMLKCTGQAFIRQKLTKATFKSTTLVLVTQMLVLGPSEMLLKARRYLLACFRYVSGIQA